jgi:fructose-bisphosphate aldolase class II
MELEEGADRCTAGNASKIKVTPRAEMAELYRTGKLDPRIADTACTAE